MIYKQPIRQAKAPLVLYDILGGNLMLRCSKCKEAIIEETKYMDWLAIFNFFEFLYHEEYIEKVTYESMMDKIQTFKEFCFEGEK